MKWRYESILGWDWKFKETCGYYKKIKIFFGKFFSIKEWQLDYLLDAKDFLLDSGAFSFMNGRSRVNFEEYIKKYAEFINHYHIKNFFELDIEDIVGWDEYVRLNDILCKKTWTKPIPVFHKNRGKEWFLNALEEYTYIAYGGIAVDRKSMKKMKLKL